MQMIENTNKKRILFRLRSMEMGGAQKVLLNIIEHLDCKKYEIFVLLDLKQGQLLNQIPKNIRLFYLTRGRESFSQNFFLHFIQLLLRRFILKIYELFPAFEKKKLGFEPDIEVAFMHSSLKRLVNSPFKSSKKINWFHSDIRFYPLKTATKTAKFINKCCTTVFVSDNTYKNFELFAKTKILNATVLYNPFNVEVILNKAGYPIVEREIFDKKKNLFVSVGRIVFQKGYDLLLEVHAELIKEGIDHQIVIIGQGPDYDKLSERISLLNVEKTFKFIGEKENPYPYIYHADYYIQPSRYEAYPLCIGEALILNKPIIATDCGGIREMLIHGKTGFIVNFSKKELKMAMKRLIFDKQKVYKIIKEQKNINFERHNEYIYSKLEKLLKTIN